MNYLAIGEQVCKMPFWDRIENWQVVLTVFIIITGYVIINVARLYFMVDVAKHCPSCGSRQD